MGGWQKAVFHPITVLIVATLSTLVFIALMWSQPQFVGEGRFYLLAYHAPIGFAFVVYVFDRAQQWRKISKLQWVVEPFIIALALLRALIAVPFYSGHALFLTYAWITSRSALLRWIGVLVALDVIWIKIALADSTIFGGILLGGVTGWIIRRQVQCA